MKATDQRAHRVHLMNTKLQLGMESVTCVLVIQPPMGWMQELWLQTVVRV